MKDIKERADKAAETYGTAKEINEANQKIYSRGYIQGAKEQRLLDIEVFSTWVRDNVNSIYWYIESPITRPADDIIKAFTNAMKLIGDEDE